MHLSLWIILLYFNLVKCSLTEPPPEKQQEDQIFDYVIVGCGASGLALASKLSLRFEWSILCLEAGNLDNYEAEILIPYYIGLQPPGFYDWQIYTTPQHQLDGAIRHVPMGKGVGGGTLINGMVWNRGNQESYNSWANLGNRGWTWEDLLPYFIRSETFTTRDYPEQHFPAAPPDPWTHGSYGPVQVSYPNYFWPQSNNWFSALNSLGVPTSADPNDGLSAGGYFLPLSMNPQNQTRSDARRTYYDLAMGSNATNLHVYPNSQVTRIIFRPGDRLHATGVEFVQGTNESRMIVSAAREVILAAGAIHTPQLLELSGVGQSSILEQLGIQVLEDLPGVGNNLQDHGLIHLNYPYTNPSLVTIDNFVSNQTFNGLCSSEYFASKSGPWTAKPSQAVAFPSLSQATSNASTMLDCSSINADHFLPSNYESTLRAGYQRQLQSIIAELRNSSIPAFEILNNNAGGLDLALMRPLSRGTCHIASTNPFDQPVVDPRWLAHPFDHDVMITAMQFNQRLLRTPALTVLQPTYLDVPFNATTEQLDAILRARIGTEYHYSGTAAMLPRELGGVVDNHLVVYGTDNLRVVDTSIYPTIPGAHLQAVAYAVAEYAADIIKGVVDLPARN